MKEKYVDCVAGLWFDSSILKYHQHHVFHLCQTKISFIQE